MKAMFFTVWLGRARGSKHLRSLRQQSMVSLWTNGGIWNWPGEKKNSTNRTKWSETYMCMVLCRINNPWCV